MKYNILLTALLCVISSSYAQEKITQDLEKFTELKAFDQIEVTLVKSDKNQIVITGDEKEEVSIVNKKGLLKIKMPLDNHMDGGDIKAKLYYTEDLVLLDANENAKIFSEGTFKGKEVKIAVQEGADIQMNVAIETLFVKSTSGSEIILKGKATTQEVVANTGGKVYNKDLATQTTKVTVNAGGTAEIKATKKADAKVRAGGVITIYGNPKEIIKDKVFGGNIKVIE